MGMVIFLTSIAVFCFFAGLGRMFDLGKERGGIFAFFAAVIVLSPIAAFIGAIMWIWGL